MHLIKKITLKKRNKWVNNKVKKVKDKINSIKRTFNLIMNLKTKKQKIQERLIIKMFMNLMCKVQSCILRMIISQRQISMECSTLSQINISHKIVPMKYLTLKFEIHSK